MLPFKEIENLLLSPKAIQMAAGRIVDKDQYPDWPRKLKQLIDDEVEGQKSNVYAQRIGERTKFVHKSRGNYDATTLALEETKECDKLWLDEIKRLQLVPGKDVFSSICKGAKERLNITLTVSRVAAELDLADINLEFLSILEELKTFMQDENRSNS